MSWTMLLALCAVQRLGDDAYGTSIRDEIERLSKGSSGLVGQVRVGERVCDRVERGLPEGGVLGFDRRATFACSG